MTGIKHQWQPPLTNKSKRPHANIKTQDIAIPVELMQEHWISIENLNIRYLESEKDDNKQKEKRNVLLIHGLGSSADRWAGILDHISSRFHTTAVDLPGFGKSDKPSTIEYTIDMFRDTVIEFLSNTLEKSKPGGDKNVSIIGHSLGGYIAAEVAIKLKDAKISSQQKVSLEKLVLIDSSGMLVQPTPLLDQYLEAAMDPSKDKVRKVFEGMVADPRRVPSFLVESFVQRMSDNDDGPNAKYAFESTLKNSANTQVGLDRLRIIGDTPHIDHLGKKRSFDPASTLKTFQGFNTKCQT